MIKVDRPQGVLHALFELRRRSTDLDRPDAWSTQQLEADAGAFEQKLAQPFKHDDDEASSDDDGSRRPSPFDLFPKMHTNTASDSLPIPAQAVPDIVREIVREVYVSDDNIADRRVSVRLAEHVLPGVMLSIHEDEGRVNVDFMCSAEPSRACLREIAPRLSTELANQLNRDTRVCVRSEDPEDPDPFHIDGSPTQASPAGAPPVSKAQGQRT
ncbi:MULTISPECIES: hypothetical protein [unclassified Bordetella]|uniref:hypothetical protein n=1 Tax=unclassified Bordetella TaxID=2630031 RepID=UPI00132310E2|nr:MULTISPECIES: hypothetical protein [unclassified Bordetella]MVW70475.1 hypothetical protein [Bordetella sp. 15P40C-2]MVW78586.1 hypothetical protein [Bordetella sp. 02P26C-1]